MSGLQIFSLLFIVLIVLAVTLGFVLISLPSDVIRKIEKRFTKKSEDN